MVAVAAGAGRTRTRGMPDVQGTNPTRATMRKTFVTNKATLRRLEEILRGRRVFSLDTETTSIVALEAQLEIITITTGRIGNEHKFVIPFYACVERAKALRLKAAKTRQKFFTPDPLWGAPYLQPREVLDVLRPFLVDRHWLKVMHNSKYDMAVLGNYGIHCRNVWCSMIAGFLVNENRLKGLKDRCKDVGLRLTDYKAVQKALKEGGSLQDYFDYASMDSTATLRLYYLYADTLKKDGVHEVFIKQENRMPAILCDMERRGILIDQEFVKGVDKQVKRALLESRAKIYSAAGGPINLGSPPQLGAFLFDRLGLTSTIRTPKGKPSTNAAALEEMSSKHPVVAEILNYRTLSKLDVQYTDPTKGVMSHILKDGRIHPSFNPVGAITGRFSCNAPNLQNIPRSNEDSYHIRKAFIASPGKVLIVADYNQIELRLLAHYSQDPIMMKAYQNDEDLHQVTADALGVERPLAKNLNFGTVYGIGAKKFARMAKISEDKARDSIRAFFRLYAYIDVLKNRVNRIARTQGYIKLMTGRKRRVLGLDNPDPYEAGAAERQVINSLIQGSSADLLKAAMIRIYESVELRDMGCEMLLQVHDELVFECPKAYAKVASRIIDRLMCKMPEGVELRVPIRTAISQGVNWEEGKS